MSPIHPQRLLALALGLAFLLPGAALGDQTPSKTPTQDKGGKTAAPEKSAADKEIGGAERQAPSYRRVKRELKRIATTRAELTKGTPPGPKAPALDSAGSPVLAPRRRVLALSLDDAIRHALRNGYAGLIATETARARAYGVPQARAAFDPSFQLGASTTKSRKTQSFTNPLTGLPNFVSNQNNGIQFNASIDQTLPWGTVLRLTGNQSRSVTAGAKNNPQIRVDSRMTITQPLLRGLGSDVNLAALRNSRLDKKDANSDLAQQFQNTIVAVRRAYWAVVSAETSLRVQQANLDNGLDLLEGERFKQKMGTRRQLDVAIAEATVARRREAVIRAETSLENVRDELLNLVAPSSKARDWDLFIVPIDRPTYVARRRVSLGAASKIAGQRRFDLQNARRAITRQERNLQVARNGQLPSLDLSLSGGISAVGRKHLNTYRLLDPVDKAFDLSAGLTLRFPLILRAERARAAAATHDLRRAQLNYRRLEATVMLELRKAIRAVTSAQERVAVNQQGLLLSENQLKTEREAVRFGKATPRNILQSQQNLANAELSLQQALIDFREAIAGFDASMGVLLDRFRDELPSEALEGLRGATR